MSSADTSTETAPEPLPGDDVRKAIVDALTEELGDAVLGSELAAGDAWLRVDRSAWRRTAEVCKNKAGLDYFGFLSGIDWMPASQPNPEEAAADTDVSGGDDDDEGAAASATDDTTEETQASDTEPAVDDEGFVTGVTGGDTRFQVFARFYSTKRAVGITVKADLDDDDPRVDTISQVYRGADWHERETWEMYGFVFEGHPDLRHMYLPTEFDGYPLRKDFPLLAREVKPWPGIVDVEAMPDEGEGEPGPEREQGTEG